MNVRERIQAALRSNGFRNRVTDLASEFFLEAAVLVGVLGILEVVVTRGKPPTLETVSWSLGLGFVLFVVSCTIQAMKDWTGPLLDEEEDEDG